jgi:hypothetical protein
MPAVDCVPAASIAAVAGIPLVPDILSPYFCRRPVLLALLLLLLSLLLLAVLLLLAFLLLIMSLLFPASMPILVSMSYCTVLYNETDISGYQTMAIGLSFFSTIRLSNNGQANLRNYRTIGFRIKASIYWILGLWKSESQPNTMPLFGNNNLYQMTETGFAE